ncbi:MAG: TonB family protein, partial [Nitrospinota bacterium]
RKYWGRLQLRFVIRDDGRLHRVVLLKSSGYRILDEEALSAIAEAAPFKPFPARIKRKLLPIHGSFVYVR